MAAIKYKGFEYEIPTEFTNREMIRIEQIAGCTASEFARAYKTKNISWGMLIGLAFTAMQRAGATIDLDELLDAEAHAVEWPTKDAPEVADGSPLPGPVDAPAT